MKAFVVSLDNPTGRARMEILRERAADIGLEIEKFDAKYGKTMNWNTVIDEASTVCALFCTPAVVGCALSHVELWRKTVRDGLEWALILEDDAKLVDDAVPRIERAIEQAPEGWDVLLLGCFMCGKNAQRIYTTFASSGVSELETRNGMRRVIRFGGTHAYIVSAAGAKKLVSSIGDNITYHIDQQMSGLPNLNKYVVEPQIALQNSWVDSENAASVNFPGTIDTILRKVGYAEGEPPLHYLMNVGWYRFGTWKHHVVMTTWHKVLFIAGFLGLPWKVFTVFAAVDVSLVATEDAPSKLAAYFLGFIARALWIHYRLPFFGR